MAFVTSADQPVEALRARRTGRTEAFAAVRFHEDLPAGLLVDACITGRGERSLTAQIAASNDEQQLTRVS